MSCGARIQVVRRTDWAAIDKEVRDIMLRVWGVQPIDWAGQILLTAGPPSAIERLKSSVEWVRLQMEPQLMELESGQGPKNVNLDWLDAFVREPEIHTH